MERIASFTVNHDTLRPGLYLSRRDGNVTTFDLRFKRPNTGDLLTNAQMHSVEQPYFLLPANGCHHGGNESGREESGVSPGKRPEGVLRETKGGRIC